MLTVKKANAAEVNELISVYIEKVKWLRAANKTMWDEAQFAIEELNRIYNNPVFYVGIVNNTVVGGFILIENDMRYWPEKNDSAYYFHKFVVANAYCGKGYSDEMIEWVKNYGKENGKKYIRLDYDGNRKPIMELYTRNGFCPVEIISNDHVKRLVKAEYLIK